MLIISFIAGSKIWDCIQPVPKGELARGTLPPLGNREGRYLKLFNIFVNAGDWFPGARDLSERRCGGRKEIPPPGWQAQPCNVPPQNVAVDWSQRSLWQGENWWKLDHVLFMLNYFYVQAIEENESVAKAWFRRGSQLYNYPQSLNHHCHKQRSLIWSTSFV